MLTCLGLQTCAVAAENQDAEHVGMVRASSDCGTWLILQSVMQQARSVSICFAPCRNHIWSQVTLEELPNRGVQPAGEWIPVC